MARRVAILGATGTIGSAVAHALADRGQPLALAARDLASLERFAQQLPNPADINLVALDLQQPDGPESIAAALLRGGSVDDLVVCVGPFDPSPVETMTSPQLAAAFSVHAAGPMLLVRELRSSLAAARGAVVALSDEGVVHPYPHYAAYLAAKGALDSGMRALAVELAPDVRVNVLRPGVVSDPAGTMPSAKAARLSARSLSKRLGKAQEVAHVVLAMLDASWVWGQAWTIG